VSAVTRMGDDRHAEPGRERTKDRIVIMSLPLAA
jgi:hypothetical protein